MTSVEPSRRYACHRGTTCPVTPDGAVKGTDGGHDTIDVTFAPTLAIAKRRATLKRFGHGNPQRRQERANANRDRRRQARVDQAAGRISRRELDARLQQCANDDQNAYHPGYSGPCAAAGDRFHPVILTPCGGWWRWGDHGEHGEFLANIVHSGDEVPDYDIEAPRFDHHARTWASWTHTAFLRQAVSCAIAVATYGAAARTAKDDLRAAGRSANHPRGDLLAAGSDSPVRMPVPACAA